MNKQKIKQTLQLFKIYAQIYKFTHNADMRLIDFLRRNQEVLRNRKIFMRNLHIINQ
jgi:hypothetical protein